MQVSVYHSEEAGGWMHANPLLVLSTLIQPILHCLGYGAAHCGQIFLPNLRESIESSIDML